VSAKTSVILLLYPAESREYRFTVIQTVDWGARWMKAEKTAFALPARPWRDYPSDKRTVSIEDLGIACRNQLAFVTSRPLMRFVDCIWSARQ
jgi:hypothetical protein